MTERGFPNWRAAFKATAWVCGIVLVMLGWFAFLWLLDWFFGLKGVVAVIAALFLGMAWALFYRLESRK